VKYPDLKQNQKASESKKGKNVLLKIRKYKMEKYSQSIFDSLMRIMPELNQNMRFRTLFKYVKYICSGGKPNNYKNKTK
jgi:hypothetical protein